MWKRRRLRRDAAWLRELRRPMRYLHVSVAVPVTVFVLLPETGAVAVIVTAPFVAPTQVAVPLSMPLLLIETFTVSDTVHVWPQQFTHAADAHWPFVTGVAKNCT